MSDIEARVRKIVAEKLNVDEEKVTNTSTFVDELECGFVGYRRVGDGPGRRVPM